MATTNDANDDDADFFSFVGAEMTKTINTTMSSKAVSSSITNLTAGILNDDKVVDTTTTTVDEDNTTSINIDTAVKPATISNGIANINNDTETQEEQPIVIITEEEKQKMEEDLFGPKVVGSRDRTDTNDSFLDMMDDDDDIFNAATSIHDISDFPEESPEKNNTMTGTANTNPIPVQATNPQDILDWIEGDDNNSKKKDVPKHSGDSPGTLEEEKKESTVVEEKEDNMNKKDNEGKKNDDDNSVHKKDNYGDNSKDDSDDEEDKPIVFDTLNDAIRSSKSSVEQIRSLFVKEKFKVQYQYRRYLWCRAVCGKTLDDIMSSSIADSFLQWDEEFNVESTYEIDDDDERTAWIKKEAAILAERIVIGTNPNDDEKKEEENNMIVNNDGTTSNDNNDICMTLEEAKRSLTSMLLYHYKSRGSLSSSSSSTSLETAANGGKDNVSSSNDESTQQQDALLPPVACAILAAGVPTAAASVMLSTIQPAFMPILALNTTERSEAARLLHTQFYRLASYHLPLLVHHLDRYAVGWYWPRKLNNNKESANSEATHIGRNAELHGMVPQSWLISHLAGECNGTFMNPKWLNTLWDLILVSSNNSLRFFFALAILEKNSDILLMLTGEKLRTELKRIMEFKEAEAIEGFTLEGDEDATAEEAVDWVQEWCDRARTLWELTPRSVVSRLRAAEDDAVTNALLKRQQVKEETLEARLEAEAKAHREAMTAQRDKQLSEARARLSRARLVAYYHKYNPEKVDSVDKILETFDGRLDVLDAKLKTKYGVGFNPALGPKKTKDSKGAKPSLKDKLTQKFSKRDDGDEGEETDGENENEANDCQNVTVAVTAAEVLPTLCWSKVKDPAKLSSRRNDVGDITVPLKFFLVDSRGDDIALQQGRFPTATSMSPDTLMDPDKMARQEEMFESLRGTVHIVVMGEGFSALPDLYDVKMNSKLQQLVDEDEARSSSCALFFVKKGFPFVSILEGGFAAAHTWLAREGPKKYLTLNDCLVDYDPRVSMFAELENSYQEQLKMKGASTAMKTQKALQNLFDSSLTSLALTKDRLEKMTAKKPEPHRKKEFSFMSKKLPPKKPSVENGNEVAKTNPTQRITKLFSQQNSFSEESDGNESEKENTPESNETKFQPFANLRTKVDNLRKKDETEKETAGTTTTTTTEAIQKSVGIAPTDSSSGEIKKLSANIPRFKIPFGNRKVGAIDDDDGGDVKEDSVNLDNTAKSKPPNPVETTGVENNKVEAKVESPSVASSEAVDKKVEETTPIESSISNAAPVVEKATESDADVNKGDEKVQEQKGRFAGFGAALNKQATVLAAKAAEAKKAAEASAKARLDAAKKSSAGETSSSSSQTAPQLPKQLPKWASAIGKPKNNNAITNATTSQGASSTTPQVKNPFARFKAGGDKSGASASKQHQTMGKMSNRFVGVGKQWNAAVSRVQKTAANATAASSKRNSNHQEDEESLFFD